MALSAARVSDHGDSVDAPESGENAWIAFDGVDKSYREGSRTRMVFRDLTASIGSGGMTALLGRSGSGKSTLLNLLGAIDVADAGRVSVAGVDLGALGERERTLWRRREVGIVFQFFNLIPTLDVRENVMLPLELAGVRARASRARALEMLAEVGLADRGASFPEALSGGEQQRVAIARALVARPPLVLADEPTGNLDHETAGEVLDLLARLTAETAVTVVMATHSAEAAARAGRVLRVSESALVESAAGTVRSAR